MKYFIITGEPSGDLHARNLIKGLETEDPDASVYFWDSSRMVSVMGFTEVISKLPDIVSISGRCWNALEEFAPDVLILVDYPGFNLRMARKAHRKGLRTYYYIPPKLWARGEGRIRKIRRYVDRVYIIFPFEDDYFHKRGVDALYFGNPLLDSIGQDEKIKLGRDAFLKRNSLPDKPLIALLAGSRSSELAFLMPRFTELEKKLRKDPRFKDYLLVIAGAPKMHPEDYRRYLPDDSSIKLLFGETYPLLSFAEAAVISSGTASLEAALIGTPQVVCYGFNRLTYMLAKMVVKVRFISLANLILDRLIFKELIQDDSSTDNIYSELARLVFDGKCREGMLSDYSELRRRLGGGGASSRIANDIYKSIKY